MQLHAVVPVKSLERAKSRLAGVLSPAERRLLVLEMLGCVLDALRRSQAASVWVISADRAVLAAAEARGIGTLLDRSAGLNDALEQARGALVVSKADAMLVVPADVPLITPGDVSALAGLLGQQCAVALAPDAADQGTNALALDLGLPEAVALPFAFGQGSAARHLRAAAERGLGARVYRSPTLALDVDDAASLARYRAAEPFCHRDTERTEVAAG